LENISDISGENLKAALEEETLIISLGSKLRVSEFKTIYDWFINNEVFSSIDSSEKVRLPKGFINDVKVQKEVVKFFETFDDSIKAFTVTEHDTIEQTNDKKKYSVHTRHKVIDSDEYADIALVEESGGTLTMLTMFQFIKNALERGSVLFIDEINSKLHPLLVRNIILMFANPKINIKNAQLIFTTHDTTQLSTSLLRRDEIWFINKESNGVSKLKSLADVIDDDGDKIRKDENYEKNYLLGKYGAIPSLKAIAFLVEDQ